MQKESQNKCCICGNSLSALVESSRDYFILKGNSPEFSIDECEQCSVAFSYPYLSDNDLAAYYPGDYEAYEPKRSFFQYLQDIKYKSDIKIINKYLASETKSVFEIGAGRGEFLSTAKKNAYSVAGVEPSQAGVDAAKKYYQIELTKAYASHVVFEKTYDVIVLRHVLEHVNEFYACLKNIFSNGLQANGILFLKLPNYNSTEAEKFGQFWSGYDLPRHRVHFTNGGIEKLLKDIGFSRIIVLPEVVPSDLARSISYKVMAGKAGGVELFINALPGIFKLPLCQILAKLKAGKTAGRMIIVAVK